MIGFIGLGVMGEPICRNLAAKSGQPVLAYDLRPDLKLTGSLQWRQTRYAIGKDRYSGYDFSLLYSFLNPRVYAFNKAQMYSGSPTVQVVSFDAPASDFALLPSNARLQTGTPPAGA